MAIGVPVIGTYVGGVVELITPEYSGLVVSPSDIDGLSTAIKKYINDAEFRSRLMINALKDCQLSELESYPVCIIGGGAAGITLAIALSRQGKRVLLIEGGDWKEVQNNDAYTGEAVSPHATTTEFRYQRLGGTTHLWGGRCVPLDSYDLSSATMYLTVVGL
ncbi:conserved hypothetical protein [Ricinus communis]|uniref:Uncharacterized protein n=1 Tax=Ricinus communis TaxID=3988 RepID=B9TF09_RICCO|nr:conserved hypothetical protein [Ricinus communis]